jgi:hypothetical protein
VTTICDLGEDLVIYTNSLAFSCVLPSTNAQTGQLAIGGTFGKLTITDEVCYNLGCEITSTSVTVLADSPNNIIQAKNAAATTVVNSKAQAMATISHMPGTQGSMLSDMSHFGRRLAGAKSSFMPVHAGKSTGVPVKSAKCRFAICRPSATVINTTASSMVVSSG